MVEPTHHADTLTTTPLVRPVGTVFVSITLQGLREALAHVPTRELSEGAPGLYFHPAARHQR